MSKKKEERKEKDKMALTFLILFFPTVLVIAVTGVADPILRTVLQILIALFQGILIKNFLGEYYSLDNGN